MIMSVAKGQEAQDCKFHAPKQMSVNQICIAYKKNN